jgi:alpha-methylacyl-CoA racemase
VVEFGGLGPLPFCATMLADHGAQVLRIERPGQPGLLPGDPDRDVLARSRTVIGIDLSGDEGRALARKLCAQADVVAEGFRPGVMERLGLGPDVLRADNPRLVYARMTGWGQDGPYARMAGHDINYLAISGALHAIGEEGERPTVPLNLVADFGGGGMMLAFAIVAALLNSRSTGTGQVVDCAMSDGSAMLMSMTYSMHAQGHWSDERGTNLLDGGASYYGCYETRDGRHIAIGSLEPAFRRILLDKLGLADDPAFDLTLDSAGWHEQKPRIAAAVRMKTQAEWSAIFDGTDACVAPVAGLGEAPLHHHNVARSTFVELDGIVQPAPAPRFLGTPAAPPSRPLRGDGITDGILGGIGIDKASIADLRDRGIVR